MIDIQGFIKEYLDLLITQYSGDTKATEEITLKAEQYWKVYEFYLSFFNAFDIDSAVGDQLDIIGKIVGIPRIVPFFTVKQYFGFDDNPNSLTFGEGVFFDRFTDSGYTDTELSDIQMRILIKVKIAKNITSPFMVSDDRVSLQNVINTAFDGAAYVIDNFNMFLTLYVDETITITDIALIRDLGLLPSPQGVGYSEFISYSPTATFGFSDNANAKTFNSGVFANKLVF